MLDFYLNVLNITENDMYIFMIILFTWIIPVTILLRIISFFSNVPNAFEKSFLYCKILYFSFIVLFFLVSFIFSIF